jgi:hypothetical protein
MPGFDRTGPEGKGPRTGRGLGKCNPENRDPEGQVSEEDFPRRRRRFLRMGRGRGFRRGGY